MMRHGIDESGVDDLHYICDLSFLCYVKLVCHIRDAGEEEVPRADERKRRSLNKRSKHKEEMLESSLIAMPSFSEHFNEETELNKHFSTSSFCLYREILTGVGYYVKGLKELPSQSIPALSKACFC